MKKYANHAGKFDLVMSGPLNQSLSADFHMAGQSLDVVGINELNPMVKFSGVHFCPEQHQLHALVSEPMLLTLPLQQRPCGTH